jgi:hypothetical protein
MLASALFDVAFSMSLSPKEPPARFTTAEQRLTFQNEGFIVMSGLLSEEQTNQLVAAGRIIVDHHIDQSSLYFKLAERGIMICGPSNPQLSEEHRSTVVKAFRDVALRSSIPFVAAELMGLDPNEENVRILRDVFLGKHINEQKHCGWHVDDNSFWPESYTASPSVDGINAWIAMQDMPSQFGGALGLAPGSHVAEWRHTAYESLGLDLSDDSHSKQDVYRHIKDNGFLSCILHQTNKELHDRIEGIGRVPDLQCGDVIFHTRWLFHKTVPPTDEGRLYFTNNGLSCLNRYSIRYVPGSARLPKAFVNELSILSDASNAGKALNDVDGAWYPQVWPFLEDDIEKKIGMLVSGRIPDATRIMQSNLGELLQVLSESTKEFE